ncbi:MAG: TraB/GumN family protein [Burkholderiaceae bacterium]
MEKDSEIYIKLDQMREVVLSKARACAEFVQQNLGLAVDTIPADVSYPRDYEKYVNRHLDQLPFFARVVLEPMINDYNDLNTQWGTMRSESMGPRDQHMANKIRQGLTHDGPNFVVVGSAHLKGLREQLNDLPCIFMNPKKVVAEFPSTTLREGPLNLGRKKL